MNFTKEYSIKIIAIVIALIVLLLITRVFYMYNYMNKQKWTVIGDSWTEENDTASNNYVKLISKALNLETINLGISGAGFKSEAENGKAYYQRIKDIPSDTSILTIMASGNDLSRNYVLGLVSDTGTHTICGCINTALDEIYNKFPGIRIGIISVAPWKDMDNLMFDKYTEAIRQICELRSIPFLDLLHSSNLRPEDETFRINYMPDGVHPNDAGYLLFSNRIKQFIEGL